MFSTISAREPLVQKKVSPDLERRFAASNRKLEIGPTSRSFGCFKARIDEMADFNDLCLSVPRKFQSANLQSLVRRVDEGASRFLLKGAKYPIDSEVASDPFQRSYLDYFHSGAATYFRSTGSGALNLLKHHMEGQNPLLKKFAYFPTESLAFPGVMASCSDGAITINHPNQIDEALRTMVIGKTRCFLDISPLLEGVTNQKKIADRLEDIKQRVAKCSWSSVPGIEIIVGGSVLLPVYPERVTHIPTFICFSDANNTVQDIIQTTGYGISLAKVPELLQAYGLTAQGISELMRSDSSDPNIESVHEFSHPLLAIREIVRKLDKLLVEVKSDKSLPPEDFQIKTYYLNLVRSALVGLIEMRNLGFEEAVEEKKEKKATAATEKREASSKSGQESIYNKKLNELITNALVHILENISEEMEPQNIDLIFEEIVFLLSVCEPKEDRNGSLSNLVARTVGSAGKIKPIVTLQSSGMLAFTSLIQALAAEKSITSPEKLKVMCSNARYFELGRLLSAQKGVVDSRVETFLPTEMDKIEANNCDVIFLDLHSNNFVLPDPTLQAHDFTAIHKAVAANIAG